MAIEIEAKYKINLVTYNNIIKYFEDEKISGRIEFQNDIYFSPRHFPFLGGEIDNECLRIRKLLDKNILSYKKFVPKTSDKEAYSIEHEVEIGDIEKFKLILDDLRIDEVFTLNKKRIYYIYDNIEIALDYVTDLGYFVELELISDNDSTSFLEAKEKFVALFEIDESMRNYSGYSYLLYDKYKKSVN